MGTAAEPGLDGGHGDPAGVAVLGVLMGVGTAGVTVFTTGFADAEGVPIFDVEISPLFASNAEDFETKWKEMPDRPNVENGFYI